MKKVVFLVLSALSFGLNAQKLNEKGLYVNYDENSAILYNSELFNGIVSETKDGIKAELTIKEGVVDGPVNYYYASGNLMETGVFTKGQKDQKWIRFNENGTTSAIAFYNLGKKSGTWLVFDDMGKKRFEMNYADGEKTGIWTSWDENGAVISTKDYSQAN
jgi:antitoxin component YwqK of YwqJK toxin-antitoxin module